MDAVRGDLDAATPERLFTRAEELRAAREVAREAAAAVPNPELGRVAELRAALDGAERGLREAEARRARLTERFDRIPAWRRRERSELRAGLTSAGEDVERHRTDGRATREELARLGPASDGNAREWAQALTAELSSIDRRLDSWREGPAAERHRSDVARVRVRPPVDRGLKR